MTIWKSNQDYRICDGSQGAARYVTSYTMKKESTKWDAQMYDVLEINTTSENFELRDPNPTPSNPIKCCRAGKNRCRAHLEFGSLRYVIQ